MDLNPKDTSLCGAFEASQSLSAPQRLLHNAGNYHLMTPHIHTVSASPNAERHSK